MLAKLKDQQENVVKPLIGELKLSKEICRRLRAMNDQNVKEIKEISTVLRIPTMTTQLWKMLRNRESEKVFQAHQK